MVNGAHGGIENTVNLTQLRAAALGARIGATLGAPRRGEREFRAISFYEPIPSRMAPADFLDAWLVWRNHLSESLPPECIGDTRLEQWQSCRTEAIFGESNLSAGLRPPISGQFDNPLGSSGSALARCLFWGLALPPEEAGDYAWFDASCDQGRDVAKVAFAIARACSSIGLMPWLRALIDALGNDQSLRSVVQIAMNGVTTGVPFDTFAKSLARTVDDPDEFGLKFNLAVIVASLCEGKGEFDASLLACASCGGAADTNCAIVGALCALWAGSVPLAWTEPLSGDYVATASLKKIDPPASWESYVDAIFPTEPPEIVEEATPTPMRSMPMIAPNSSTYFNDDLRVTAEFVDSPVSVQGKSNQILLTVQNLSPDPRIIAPIWDVAPGVELAHRFMSVLIKPGSKHQFPMVVSGPPNQDLVTVQIGGLKIPIKLLSCLDWYSCGPMPNYDGTSFEKVFRCEDVQRLSETFAGRGDQGVRWKRFTGQSNAVNVEPLFLGGPGVAYLYGKFRFAQPGVHKIVVASSPGTVVRVNRNIVIKYLDTHQPVARPRSPYVAEFRADGTVEVIIKVMRDLVTVPCCTVYFIGPDGQIALPIESLPMED